MKIYVIMYIEHEDNSIGAFSKVYLTQETADSVVAVLAANNPSIDYNVIETDLEEKWVH